MGKVHELVAVKESLAKSAKAISDETYHLFSKKHEHFDGLTKRYSPAIEYSADGKELGKGETFPDEIKGIVTTVPNRLEYHENRLARFIDWNFQVETSNSEAKADIELDGEILAANVPVTALLNLKSRMEEYKAILLVTPTLDPAKSWLVDEQNRHQWKTAPKDTYRTSKETKYIITSQATKEHPAQVAEKTVDTRVGTWTTTEFSGRLSPVEKVSLLENCDNLIQAIETARSRANQSDASNAQIAKRLFKFIHTGA